MSYRLCLAVMVYGDGMINKLKKDHQPSSYHSHTIQIMRPKFLLAAVHKIRN